AMLQEIKRRGKTLYTELNAKTAAFAERLKNLFIQTKVPLRLLATGSIISIRIIDENPLSKLFFYHLIYHGVHMVEKAALISTEHSEEDLEKTYRAIEESIREMQTAGFFKITVADADAAQHKIVYPPSVDSPTVKAAPGSTSAEVLPLTEGQKEIWVEQQLGHQAAAAYNLSSDIELKGELHIELLEQAIQQLVDRHESLRAQYNPDAPTQKILPGLKVDLPVLDLSDHADPQAALAALRNEEGTVPIDIFAGPAFRFQLIRLSATEHRLFMTVHHMIADGWSCGILAGDLSRLYTAAVGGTTADLPEARQLSAYVQDQEAFRQSEAYAEAEAYWLAQFEKDVPVLEFPTDHPRPAKKTYDAALEKMSIDADTYQSLKKLAAKEGTTFFVLLYAAFQTFLHRLSGQDDFVLGVVAAGQSIAGNENLVAHGVSLLPVRGQLEGQQAFAKYLKTARNTVLDAFEHQQYTLGALVKKLNLPRDLSRQPIISILFNMDSDMADIWFGDLETSFTPIPRQYETFDIFINVKPVAGGVDFEWIYNTDLF
ncbi:MAG: condensation domain-containing protein, partial [Bacteroidota bacterium]